MVDLSSSLCERLLHVSSLVTRSEPNRGGQGRKTRRSGKKRSPGPQRHRNEISRGVWGEEIPSGYVKIVI